MRRLKPYVPAISVFMLALLVRILYNVTIAADYYPKFDAAIYDILGHNILNAHCFCYTPSHPTLFRPPLWPFIIAIIYFFFGEHNAYVRVFSSFLGSGMCLLVYFFARDLFGKRIGLVTGIIAALYTGLFIWDGWLYTETLYTFCLTAFTYALYRLQQSAFSDDAAPIKKLRRLSQPRWRWMILSGIFLGLTALARPNGSLLVGLLCVWAALVIFAKLIPWRSAIQSVLVIVVIALALNAPWLYRNYSVNHSIFQVSTIGTTLVGAYNDRVAHGDNVIAGMWLPPPGTINPDTHFYTLADEQADTGTALTWLRTHMSEVPALLGLHVAHMWAPYIYIHGLPFEEFPNRPSFWFMVVLIYIMSIPIFLLAALGLFVTWKRGKQHLLVVYLVIAMTFALNIVFYGSPRFRAPIEPLLVLLTGGALAWLKSRQSGRLFIMKEHDIIAKGLKAPILFRAL